MFWFIVLLLLAGAGFYFYQKLMVIEREIRADQDAEKAAEQSGPVVATTPVAAQETTDDPVIVTPEVEKMTSRAAPVADTDMSLEDEVLAAVANLPGIKQTELYASFTDVDKKQLQQMLKELDDAGKIRREKKGSSYLLYPV